MKYLLLLSLFTFSAFAQDMSRTESWDESYREDEEGWTIYIGGCGTHQDYEGKYFSKEKTIVGYFEPREFPVSEFTRKLAKVDPQLIAAVEADLGGDLYEVDDITIEKLHSFFFKELDLYLVNLGVGGGNGIIYVFHKSPTGLELLSRVMDGDVEYCEKKVWIK